MVKQTVSIAALIILSLIILLTMSYAQQMMLGIVTAHDWVAQTLTNIFSGGQAGNLVREFLALLAIPLLAGVIPMVIYLILKRSWFPYFMNVVWVVWLIQTAALVVLYKAS